MNVETKGALSIVALVLIVLLGLWLSVRNATTPCEAFRYASMSGVPARCIGYFSNEGNR